MHWMLLSNVESKWTARSDDHFLSINTEVIPLDHTGKAKRACNEQTPISIPLRIIAPSYRCRVHNGVHGDRDESRLAANDRHPEGLARQDFTPLACNDHRGSGDSASHAPRSRYGPENAMLQTSRTVQHAVVQAPYDNIAYDCAWFVAPPGNE